jgi:proline dehydrogenase
MGNEVPDKNYHNDMIFDAGVHSLLFDNVIYSTAKKKKKIRNDFTKEVFKTKRTTLVYYVLWHYWLWSFNTRIQN